MIVGLAQRNPTIILYQKPPAPHNLLLLEPDIEIPTHAIDVGGRAPIRPGVLGIRVAKGDVDPGNLFVLKDIADDAGYRQIGSDGELSGAIAVFVAADVFQKILEEQLVVAIHLADAAVLDFDKERGVL